MKLAIVVSVLMLEVMVQSPPVLTACPSMFGDFRQAIANWFHLRLRYPIT